MSMQSRRSGPLAVVATAAIAGIAAVLAYGLWGKTVSAPSFTGAGAEERALLEKAVRAERQRQGEETVDKRAR